MAYDSFTRLSTDEARGPLPLPDPNDPGWKVGQFYLSTNVPETLWSLEPANGTGTQRFWLPLGQMGSLATAKTWFLVKDKPSRFTNPAITNNALNDFVFLYNRYLNKYIQPRWRNMRLWLMYHRFIELSEWSQIGGSENNLLCLVTDSITQLLGTPSPIGLHLLTTPGDFQYLNPLEFPPVPGRMVSLNETIVLKGTPFEQPLDPFVPTPYVLSPTGFLPSAVTIMEVENTEANVDPRSDIRQQMPLFAQCCSQGIDFLDSLEGVIDFTYAGAQQANDPTEGKDFPELIDLPNSGPTLVWQPNMCSEVWFQYAVWFWNNVGPGGVPPLPSDVGNYDIMGLLTDAWEFSSPVIGGLFTINLATTQIGTPNPPGVYWSQQIIPPPFTFDDACPPPHCAPNPADPVSPPYPLGSVRVSSQTPAPFHPYLFGLRTSPNAGFSYGHQMMLEEVQKRARDPKYRPFAQRGLAPNPDPKGPQFTDIEKFANAVKNPSKQALKVFEEHMKLPAYKSGKLPSKWKLPIKKEERQKFLDRGYENSQLLELDFADRLRPIPR